MDLKVGHHKLAAAMAISLLGAFSPGGGVFAEPVILQEATQTMTSVLEPSESALAPAAFVVDAGDGPRGTVPAPDATQEGVTRTERNPASQSAPTKAAAQNTLAAPSGVSRRSDLAAEIHHTIRESARPLHDQLVDSGALGAWNELKPDLGLSKNKWGNEGATDVNPTRSSYLEVSNSAPWQDLGHRPTTAAQAQFDGEGAALMMEKLIAEVTPWAFSLFGLYLLGYLTQAGFDYSQRKSMRRRARETARAQRRSARKARRVKSEV